MLFSKFKAAASGWTTKQSGDAAEDQALRHLQRAGLRLMERNYRTPGRGGGEIDLIMREPDGTTVFVEVRARGSNTHGGAAASVGATTPDGLSATPRSVLLIAAKGHGTRQMCRTDKYGFPIRHVPRQKQWFGFRTGDLVRAIAPSGKKQGTHVGRVAVRTVGSFNITTVRGLIQGISHRHCQIVQRADGYVYQLSAAGRNGA